MKNTKHLWRELVFIFLIFALCGGMALPAVSLPARAAPQAQAGTPNVVISEVRTRGPSGGDDEFVELYNPTSSPIDISAWKINGSSSTGTTNTRATIPSSTTLQPGQYYLVANTSTPGYTGTVLPNHNYLSGIADDGGIALLLPDNTIIDQVGMSTGSRYKEGTPLASLSGTADQSYERKMGGNAGNCNDTNNNAADFIWNQTSSNPQNSSSPPLVCLGITNVTSTAADRTYTTGATIDITVTFNGMVDVTGAPALLLETGDTDTPATYLSGSGSNTLTFRYVVEAGDVSHDLDYASTNALTLNSGTITGAIGDAVLSLPIPGSPGSLAANKNIVIDDGGPPALSSITRQTPASERTNANNLTFRVTFSEPVANVDTGDFAQTGTTGTPASVTRVSGSVYDVTISNGDLPNLNGSVGLNLAATQNIVDAVGNPLPSVEPSIDEIYIVDNLRPGVTVNQAPTQADPANVLPVHFAVVFSEPIDVNTFSVNDISQSGIGSVTWSITDVGDHTNFTLSAVGVSSNGNLMPSIAANRIQDLAGNDNTASASSDNLVAFSDTTSPTVTINQASGQPDPTNALPIRFTIVFSEPIDTRVFTTGDITQNGTATGITWNIADSGDHRTFTLSATAAGTTGTIVPSIVANRVTDLVGNSNLASTSTDNSVTYSINVTQVSVVISEFRTSGPRGANDEFIELYNPTAAVVDISNWKINASNDTGGTSTRATIPPSTILRSGQYYLVANTAVTDGYNNPGVPPNLAYGVGISDDGGIALLRADNTPVDQVGMNAGSAYKEGTVLAPLLGTSDQSYERKPGGAGNNCQDTNNNANDFANITPSRPQNYSSPLIRCGTAGPTLITTTTTITADSPDPSLINGFVTVSVTVTGGPPTPSGFVNITGANSNCTVFLSASGTGSCSVQFTSSGTKTLLATYVGDNTHLGSLDTESHQVQTSSQATAVRTPTRVPTPLPPPPLLVINEFVPRPGHDWNLDGVVNVDDEYIEILNHGVIDVNLSGYSLDDEVNIGSAPFRLPSVTLKPGERRVFFGSETNLLLSDGGDGVRLLRPNGQLMDAYNYFVVRFPDQSYCRLPDNGGADDWNENCFPTPGLQNSLSGTNVNPPTAGDAGDLCPIADTLPPDFVFAECLPFGNNIWSPAYWDRLGWYDEKYLPESPGKWPVFVD